MSLNDRLSELLNKSTPGPWFVADLRGNRALIHVGNDPTAAFNRVAVIHYGNYLWATEHEANAMLIAEAITVIPGLLQQADEERGLRMALEVAWSSQNDRAEAAERALEESIKALRAADEWILNAPHGDNCFVSNHYEGDPGGRCNCGRESVMNHIMEVRIKHPASNLERGHES